MKTLNTAIVFACMANVALAQDVPQAVIDQCQGSVTANELPECLGEGAVGFTLLERATQSDYFGPGAERVITICQEQNETFSSAWTCVAEAADDAVETARLIGRDAIADICVRALAHAEIVDRLDQDRRDLRSHYRPSVTYFGGTMYRPFRGCPEVQNSQPPEPQTPEEAAITEQIEQCWNVHALSSEARRATIVVEFWISGDGFVDGGSIRLREFSGIGVSTAAAQLAYEAGRRALLRCSANRIAGAATGEYEAIFSMDSMRIYRAGH